MVTGGHEPLGRAHRRHGRSGAGVGITSGTWGAKLERSFSYLGCFRRRCAAGAAVFVGASWGSCPGRRGIRPKRDASLDTTANSSVCAGVRMVVSFAVIVILIISIMAILRMLMIHTNSDAINSSCWYSLFIVYKTKTRAGGSFFPYLHITIFDLSKYDIFEIIDRQTYKHNSPCRSLPVRPQCHSPGGLGGDSKMEQAKE